MNTKTTDFDAIFLKLASPDDVLSWSFGEVTKAETINYRTQRPEREGLFDERIFGPEKDYECYCGKYRRIRYKGIVCEKCGVEVTRSVVRRERMGHIALASPVSHIWFLRGIPSRLGLILGMTIADLERIIYFAGYIVTSINEDVRAEIFDALEKEYKTKRKRAETKKEKSDLKSMMIATKKEIDSVALHKVFDEVTYRQLSLKYGEFFEAGSGAETLYEICKKIDLDELRKKFEKNYEAASAQSRKKIAKQVALVKSMKRLNVRPEWMFLTVLPIIPPALRPMVQLDGGRHATSDVNDLYRRVLNRNNRLKRLLDLKAPDVIVRNEKRMLQESVDALIDNSIRRAQGAVVSQSQKRPLRSLSDMLKGKRGRFRQNLLGKRVDYSGRSVIVVGPDLKLDQCGLPKEMALELFRPFVISKLISREFAHNIRGANRLIEERTDDVWAILEEVIENKYVLLNRAPTLHRLGIQAFQPVLIEGSAIQIHPLVCSAFNADFDGDQMAVHVPLSDEAQEEAREIMSASKNLLIPRTGDPVVNPSQDIVLGCFFMTRIQPGMKGEGGYFSTPNEAILAYDFGFVDLRALIKVRVTDNPKYKALKGEIIETTVGRLLFNSVLPSDFGFINEEFAKKKLGSLINDLIQHYGTGAMAGILDKIKMFGFRYATQSGISWGMGDLREPQQKGKIIKDASAKALETSNQYEEGLLTEDERYQKSIGIWNEAKENVDENVPTSLDEFGPVFSMVSSAARGSWSQINQMTGMKGLVVNPAGKVIDFPITSSYKEGLNVLEYFISTHGARKGTADTALKTAKAGYLTRRLVDVAQDVIISEEDCGDKKGHLCLRPSESSFEGSFANKLKSRVLAQDVELGKGKKLLKKGRLITADDAENIDESDVEAVYIRSPLSCQSRFGVCRQCYGADLGINELIKLGEAAGIVAAQAIGEPGTQLTMRTFHTGGVAKTGGDITLGLPRVEELFEMRTPGNLAVISEVDGTVLEVKEASLEKGKEIKERKVLVLPSEEAVIEKKVKTKTKDKKKKSEVIEYIIPFGKRVLVKEGQEIKAGDPLTDGAIDIKILFKVAGKEAAQNYILKEVGYVYRNQGVSIHDKHIEIIIRQMFSRFKINDPGDTDFNVDKIVERTILLEQNEKAKKEGGKEAKASQLLMGVTKVSLSTSSFLSAASFQDTSRVLITTATEGGKDTLRGLKENVIIGRLIPAGTGYRKDLEISKKKGITFTDEEEEDDKDAKKSEEPKEEEK